MANTTPDGTQRQEWLPNFQRNLDRRLVAKAIADVNTSRARIMHNPYGSTPAGSDGTAATAYSIADFTLTDDTITASRRATAAEHVDNIEQLQTHYDLSKFRAERQGVVASERIDQYVLALPKNTSGVVVIDNGYMSTGVSSGVPYAVSSTTVDDLANTINQALMLADADSMGRPFWVVSPYEATDIATFTQNNGFTTADYAIKNGFTGQNFAGLDIYVSNNLAHSVTLGMATNPTAGDTVTINGVTWTFAAVPASAGEVDIGASADATRVILANAINGSATGQNSATGYFEVSAANRAKLTKAVVVATDVPGDDEMTVVASGTLTVGETFTDATDAWATMHRHTIAGVTGSLQLLLPSGGYEFEKKSVSGKHGKEIVTSRIYGAGIWEQKKPAVFDVLVS